MDVERTMQIIVDTQAKFDASMQELRAVVAANSRQIESNTVMIRQLVDVSLSLAHHGEETDRRIRELGEETDRRINETGRLIHELREAQVSTDYKLNALISTVDKLVRHNGGAATS